MFDIWNRDETIAKDVYSQNNYRVINNENCNNNRCVLYFSSNDIWFPNTEQAFRYSLIEHDYYEWIKFGCINAQKAMFFRDIYKSWYVTGINARYSSIDKLIEFIKEETEGMEIVTVGSSAGGYAASLVASILNAEYAICFSAQFNLLNKYVADANPFIKKYMSDPNRSKYFGLREQLSVSATPIYYIMPVYSNQDYDQYTYINGVENVHTLKMRTRHHGIPILKGCLVDLLQMNSNELNRLFENHYEDIVGKIKLSIEISGRKKTLEYCTYEFKRFLGKAIRRYLK